MNFELTEDQNMMRAMVRKFAEEQCLPGLEERDEKEEFSRALFDQMGELGLTGIVFPEEYGGVDGDYISYAIAVEELSRVDASVGVTLSAHVSLGSYPIYKFGTHEQKLKYLKPLAEGKALGAFGLTENMAGSDASGTRTMYVADGDSWVINGSKIFITNAYYADTYVVFAQSDRSKGHRGISAFIIEKGTPGFTFGKKEKKLGIRSSATYELVFEDCRIPKENLLGEEGQGFKIAMKTLDGGRIGIASQALGIAQGAYEAGLKYAKERVQFGKPIAEQQNTQFVLADMATQIEAARLLIYQAGYLDSAGKPFGKQSAMAKLYASEVAMWVTTKAVQMFGGYGYTREYPVERMMRDAKITEIYEGTSEVQRIVISAAVLKEF
ncbi:MAG: acyl-CoA dehydrogenase [Peptococcaceae bacterium]|jgi:alkylation response protein AidB-like acyl-CoA dehydrogenase|nr:acyl-CoA dehydrogenase [Peptococcaceae bacterium]